MAHYYADDTQAHVPGPAIEAMAGYVDSDENALHIGGALCLEVIQSPPVKPRENLVHLVL